MTSLCIGAHLLTGYLALLVIGVWVLIKPSQFLRRVGRAAIVGVGTLMAAAWVLVPLLTDAKWTTQDPFSHGNAAYDSFGALKIMRWLFTGAIFDNKRVPVISVAGRGRVRGVRGAVPPGRTGPGHSRRRNAQHAAVLRPLDAGPGAEPAPGERRPVPAAVRVRRAPRGDPARRRRAMYTGRGIVRVVGRIRVPGPDAAAPSSRWPRWRSSGPRGWAPRTPTAARTPCGSSDG